MLGLRPLQTAPSVTFIGVMTEFNARSMWWPGGYQEKAQHGLRGLVVEAPAHRAGRPAQVAGSPGEEKPSSKPVCTYSGHGCEWDVTEESGEIGSREVARRSQTRPCDLGVIREINLAGQVRDVAQKVRDVAQKVPRDATQFGLEMCWYL
jgi:hypothetical protein